MIRPMLAAKADLAKLKYPIYTSPKYDGIRCIITPEGAMSRTGKLLPNRFLQANLRLNHPFDGEIMLYHPDGRPYDFNTIQSLVMSRDGEFNFTYEIFDYVPEVPISYSLRYTLLENMIAGQFGRITPQTFCRSREEVDFQIAANLANGFEGTMLRCPRASYKHGRSTLSEGALLKHKDFIDDEARVVAVEELYHNLNDPQADEFNLTKRSSHQAGLIPAGKLGALVVSWRGVTFNIGTGFTDAERRHYWTFKPIGETVTFRYQNLSVLGVPRFPSFYRFKKEL